MLRRRGYNLRQMSSRLATAKNIWVATVRPDGRPHLAPVWFVTMNGHWYFVTDPKSVKARNLQHNSKIVLSLEDGNDPLVIEGEAKPVEPSAEVIRLFKEKYDWDIMLSNLKSSKFFNDLRAFFAGPKGNAVAKMFTMLLDRQKRAVT